MKISVAFFVAGLLIYLQSITVEAFDLESHRRLSRKAAQASGLNNYLIQQLGFSGGITEDLSDGMDTRAVIGWVEEGSVREDEGIRPLNHFHNPLRIWESASAFGHSAICWAQATDCRGGAASNGFSWQNARVRFFDGLVAESQSVRDQHHAVMFRTLGQVIHLTQDLATPAHSRNDEHFLTGPDGLHTFTERIVNLPLFDTLTGPPVMYNPSILTITPNPAAPIPIARIIDTTDPDQAEAVPSIATDIGIAEYSNANFISDSTIFTDFVFPRTTSLGMGFPEGGRFYFPKVSEGESVPHFVAQDQGTYYLSVADDPDERIFEDYGAKLLPRAVGYSAAQINYFFRGRVPSSAGDMGCPFPEFPRRDFVLGISNDSPVGKETGLGHIVILMHYRVPGQRHYLPLVNTIATLDRQGLAWEFSASTLDPIPTTATDIYLVAAYRGPLGLETDAVIGSRGDVWALC